MWITLDMMYYIVRLKHIAQILEICNSTKKSVCFYSLKDTAYSLADVHNVSDVIYLVSKKLPLDTEAEFQEDQSVSKLIADNVISITNLEALTFGTSGYKVMNIDDATNLNPDPKILIFIVFLCMMDGLFRQQQSN